MPFCKISDSVYSVGVLNPNLRVFDIVMCTEFGTSYNSYIIKGEKTVLVETCHSTFFNEYLRNITELVDPSKIDYIILNHTEPDHSGALSKLLDFCPRAQIICSQAASIYLKAITNRANLNIRVVKDGDTLDIAGRELKFINAPFLHWPDSMFTWFADEKVLFSCDFFGAHYCEPTMLDELVVYKDKYEKAVKQYYDAIFGPFATHVQNGLKKINDLDIDFVCASHGPVIKKASTLESIKQMYGMWSSPKTNQRKNVAVFYCSAYGNTKTLAQTFCEAVKNVLPDADVDMFDIIEYDISDLAKRLNQSYAFAIGSPTINRDAVPPVWQLLAHIDAINCPKKPCAVFGSYGWSGEAVGAICQRLTTLRLSVFGEGYKANFVPSESEIEKCREFADEFAKTL